MSFSEKISEIQEHGDVGELLSRHIGPQLLAQMLEATGKATIRRRNFPAERVLPLVLGMAFYRKMPIRAIVERLNLSINGCIVSSSISDARKRLGPEPISWLLDKTAKIWTAPVKNEGYRGLQVFAVDGTTFNVADSEENRNYFGKHRSRGVYLGYPQAQAVMLLDVCARIPRAWNFGHVRETEKSLSASLLRQLPANSICLLDRGFCSYERFYDLPKIKPNVNFLCRIKSNYRISEADKQDDGSYLVTITKSIPLTKTRPDLPETQRLRLISYKPKGSMKSIRLMTSLLDYRKYPARELIKLYNERWEIELAFDEIKTDMLDRQESLRSKTSDGTLQELWAIALAYGLIRHQMATAARAQGDKANLLGFKISLILIADFFWLASTDAAIGNIPLRLRDLDLKLWRLRNPPRQKRPKKPRLVKCPESKYGRATSKPPRRGPGA